MIEDPATRLDRLLARLVPQVRAQFMGIVASMLDRHTLSEIADLISRGRLQQAVDEVLRAAGRLGVVWSTTYTATGAATAGFLNRALQEVVVHFDQTNYRAVAAMRQNQLRLVREFSDEQRAATHQAIIRGVQEGANPIEQARNFRQSIGLTRYQERAVANYRRALEEGGTSALDRELRDRRFDRTVISAARDDRELSGSQIDKMVDRYRERMIAFRAETIANTEAKTALQEGNMEAYRQGVETGALDPESVTRTWNTAEDDRVRDSHDTMDGQTVDGLDEPFTTGNGYRLMFPGDPAAPAEERIRCRCSVSTRLAPVKAGSTEITVLSEPQDEE